MSSGSRLALAIGSGDLPWPEQGRIAVFRPSPETDLSALETSRCQIITGFRPSFEAFAAQGFACSSAPEGRFVAAVVFAARAKSLNLSMIASACSGTSGPVVVDGAKTDGIESILKLCRARQDVSPALSKSHGKLFWITGGPGLEDWLQEKPTRLPEGFVTAAGVFSADGIDPGSQLLAGHLPKKLGRTVADLGAGWGYLSAELAKNPDIEDLHLVEAEKDALDCARINVPDPRARFHWADALRWRPDAPLDTIVMNPPFHTGRAGDPDLGRRFIETAAQCLKPKGQLFLVANRHLPYEAKLATLFRDVTLLTDDNRFKVLRGLGPIQKLR